MKKILFVTLSCLLLVLTACVPLVPPMPQSSQPAVAVSQRSDVKAVGVRVRNNGIEADSSEVVIKNFYAGARAEMIYRIHNATSKAIRPDIYINNDADVADYSKADGAVRATPDILSWVVLPVTEDIAPGESKDFVVTMLMPEKAEKVAEKVGFQVGVAGGTGGKLQVAVGTWWLVSMR